MPRTSRCFSELDPKMSSLAPLFFNSKLVRGNGDYATNSQKHHAWHVFAEQEVNIYLKMEKLNT